MNSHLLKHETKGSRGRAFHAACAHCGRAAAEHQHRWAPLPTGNATEEYQNDMLQLTLDSVSTKAFPLLARCHRGPLTTVTSSHQMNALVDPESSCSWKGCVGCNPDRHLVARLEPSPPPKKSQRPCTRSRVSGRTRGSSGFLTSWALGPQEPFSEWQHVVTGRGAEACNFLGGGGNMARAVTCSNLSTIMLGQAGQGWRATVRGAQ